MTYLELVNAVLVRLREDSVTSISDGIEGPLVSGLVADAYKIVEEAHDWSVLRSTETVSTVASTDTVELSGVPVDSKVYYAYISGDKELRQVSKEWLARKDINGDTSTGSPTNYCITGASATDQDLVMTLYPTPDDAYDIKVEVAKRGTAPTANTDVVQLPTDPIMHMALAFCTRERGETGGTSAAEYFQLAQVSLAAAIVRDANMRPDELTLYVI